VNLWLSKEDHGASEITREQFETALAPLLPLYRGPLGYLNAPPAFGKT